VGFVEILRFAQYDIIEDISFVTEHITNISSEVSKLPLQSHLRCASSPAGRLITYSHL